MVKSRSQEGMRGWREEAVDRPEDDGGNERSRGGLGSPEDMDVAKRSAGWKQFTHASASDQFDWVGERVYTSPMSPSREGWSNDELQGRLVCVCERGTRGRGEDGIDRWMWGLCPELRERLKQTKGTKERAKEPDGTHAIKLSQRG